MRLDHLLSKELLSGLWLAAAAVLVVVGVGVGRGRWLSGVVSGGGGCVGFLGGSVGVGWSWWLVVASTAWDFSCRTLVCDGGLSCFAVWWGGGVWRVAVGWWGWLGSTLLGF